MSQDWYISRLGQVHGPVAWEQLEQWAAVGQLKADDLVWCEGRGDWSPAATLPELNLQAPPPAPPPVPRAAPYRAATSQSAARDRAARRGFPVAIALGALLLVLAAGWAGWALHGTREHAANSQPIRQDRVATAPAPTAQPPKSSSPAPTPTVAAAAANANGLPERVEPLEGLPATSERPESSTVEKSKEGAPPSPTDLKGPPESPSPTTPPPTGGRTLYQDVIISRRPSFMVAGLEISQDLQYRVFSKLTISPKNSDGSFEVRQMIYETKLLKSEGLSRAIFAESLRGLQGQELKYTLGRKHQIVKFAGPKDTRKTAAVEGLGGEAFLLTSVMDDDGWRELAQLTFFLPEEPLKKGKRWEEKITHDWGYLGSWYGKTTYTYVGRKSDEQRVDYVHRMNYIPPGKDRKDAPFEITSAAFKPLQTGGTIYYDVKQGRVANVEEKFHVRGTVSTMLLGQTSTVMMEEQQVFTIRVLDKQPTGGKDE